MVVGAFPIAKLAVLLVKQVSKPIANACKERAKSHPFFRTYVCMPPAQFYNWCEVKAKMWVLNLGKPVNIPVLSQEMAIELGANLLGEGVIFVIGAALLIFEYSRQASKEEKKEAKRMEEWQNLTDTIAELYFNVQRQETKIRELERIVLSSNTRYPQDPKSTPPSDTPKGPASPPPGGPAMTVPHHPPADTSTQQQKMVETPYPDKGVICKSLNYIQMDVFSFQLFQNIPSYLHSEQPHRISAHETAYLTSTLHNIENNFKSLF